MPDHAVKGSELTLWANSVSGNDSLMLITRSQLVPNTHLVNFSVLFSNTNFSVALGNNQSVTANTVIIRPNGTPTNSTINCVQGTIRWDADYLYVATANNTLKRVALSSF